MPRKTLKPVRNVVDHEKAWKLELKQKKEPNSDFFG